MEPLNQGFEERIGTRSSVQTKSLVSVALRNEIDRCQEEIAAAAAALLAGHRDVAGLYLALTDWSAELRIRCETQQDGVPKEHDK